MLTPRGVTGGCWEQGLRDFAKSKGRPAPILGDVFSLNELSHCVIRGKLHANLRAARSAPRAPTPPPDDGDDAPPPAKPSTLKDRAKQKLREKGDRFKEVLRRTKARAASADADALSSSAPSDGAATPPVPGDAAASPPRPPPPRPAAATPAATRWGWPAPPPPPRDDDHWDLALSAADCRVALALHPGTADFPREVLEFTPDDLAHQLNDAATTFLEAPGAFHVDEAKRVVTLPAQYLGGRWSYAYLKHIGVEDTIASSAEDYVRLAVRFATDADARRDLRRRVRENVVRLFEQEAAVRSWERALLDLAPTADAATCSRAEL